MPKPRVKKRPILAGEKFNPKTHSERRRKPPSVMLVRFSPPHNTTKKIDLNEKIRQGRTEFGLSAARVKKRKDTLNVSPNPLIATGVKIENSKAKWFFQDRREVPHKYGKARAKQKKK